MFKYKIKRQSLYFSIKPGKKQKPNTKAIIFYYSLANGCSLKVIRNLTESTITKFLKCPKFVFVKDKVEESEKTKTVGIESITLIGYEDVEIYEGL